MVTVNRYGNKRSRKLQPRQKKQDQGTARRNANKYHPKEGTFNNSSYSTKPEISQNCRYGGFSQNGLFEKGLKKKKSIETDNFFEKFSQIQKLEKIVNSQNWIKNGNVQKPWVMSDHSTTHHLHGLFHSDHYGDTIGQETPEEDKKGASNEDKKGASNEDNEIDEDEDTPNQDSSENKYSDLADMLSIYSDKDRQKRISGILDLSEMKKEEERYYLNSGVDPKNFYRMNFGMQFGRR